MEEIIKSIIEIEVIILLLIVIWIAIYLINLTKLELENKKDKLEENELKLEQLEKENFLLKMEIENYNGEQVSRSCSNCKNLNKEMKYCKVMEKIKISSQLCENHTFI